jgi:hypothetical protein
MEGYGGRQRSRPRRLLNVLEAARLMPPGPERTEAMKKAGILRNAADIQGIFFAKRGRPAK